MNPSNASSLILSGLTTFGLQAVFILSALLGLGLGFLVFYFGWGALVRMVNPGNMPGMLGYDSRRGSGASAGNVARTEAMGSTGKKINLLDP